MYISRSNDVIKQNPTCKVAAPVRAVYKYGSSAFGCDLNPHSFLFSAMNSNSFHAIFFLKDLAENIAIVTRNANVRYKEIKFFRVTYKNRQTE
jgi:hypothetical protein